MSSVRDGQPSATPTPTDAPRVTRRGSRCNNPGCGKTITRTPGKRPKIYCGESCRSAARRIIAKIEREARDGGATGKSGRLGKETTEFRGALSPAETRTGHAGESEGAQRPSEQDHDEREAASRARKSRRYAGRRTLWKVTGDNACKGCGRALMDPAAGVLAAQTAAGTSVVLGLMRCARIWFCPVCSATIRHKRAEEITLAVVEWIKRGGMCFMVTFTARHGHADRLADLMDAIQGTRKTPSTPRRPGAYQRLITGSTWAGSKGRADRRDNIGIRGRVGYLGMIRATEITVGLVNLWHPHIHAIVFVGGRTEGEKSEKRITEVFTPSESALSELEGHFRAVWTRALKQVNPDYEPSRKHGVDFKRLTTEQDAQDLGKYIAKLQEGAKSINPANEVARGDLKEGRHGNMTPFQVLYRIGDLIGGVAEEGAPGTGSLEWCLARWHEYEPAVSGRRAIEWTRYLRSMLGITGGDTEDDDKDLLLEADGESEFRAGVQITEEGWEAVARRGLDLATIEAAEGKDGNTDPEALTARVREVLALAGAADAVVMLTAGEVAEAYAAMLDSLKQRREEAAARRRREAEHDHARDTGKVSLRHSARDARRTLARLAR